MLSKEIMCILFAVLITKKFAQHFDLIFLLYLHVLAFCYHIMSFCFGEDVDF